MVQRLNDRLLALCLFFVCLCLLGAIALSGALAEPERKTIDLDHYIESQRPVSKGSRTIFVPKPVAFTARLKSHPETIEVAYLYEALSVSKVSPLPEVSHQMFVQSDGGQVIAVYVEDRLVDGIVDGLALEALAEFDAYHVYNYSRGPAMVVEAVR